MLSVFDIFKIGIGPSSSHTMGPMYAALMFAKAIKKQELLPRTFRVKVELFGSLGTTGIGHATDKGVVLGLFGEAPDTIQPKKIALYLSAVQKKQRLILLGMHSIDFNIERDIIFHVDRTLSEHPNGMCFSAFDKDSNLLHEAYYFSVGGGFVVEKGVSLDCEENNTSKVKAPYPFASASELVSISCKSQKSIAELMLENECVWLPKSEVRSKLLRIWQVMQDCVNNGFGIGGLNQVTGGNILPGVLHVRRRAPDLYRSLSRCDADGGDAFFSMEWVNAFAMAVNEENAAGGRVVTAPTNGASGVVPAVLHYYIKFVKNASENGVINFLLTAAAIGILYKTNASISGAEVGCQGEVGVACSMAAAALAAVQGGNQKQIENAAEIGMEHNLGLTCDPVAGLVQIPCIERNAMGAVKAINAARIALRGDGGHYVSLDTVIRTMKQTGQDMKSKYKETSLGGLAVNVVAC